MALRWEDKKPGKGGKSRGTPSNSSVMTEKEKTAKDPGDDGSTISWANYTIL
jgi:hypothetical protein